MHWCGLGASRRIKQKIKKGIPNKTTTRVFFTCSLRPPTLSQRHMDLHVWAYPRHGYIFHVSSKSVQWFWSPRGSKFALSHYFGYWLLQQYFYLAIIEYLYRGRCAVPLQSFTTRHSNRKLSIVMALSTTFTQCALETTKFGKITQNKGHFTVQGHSKSPILVPIESAYTTSY